MVETRQRVIPCATMHLRRVRRNSNFKLSWILGFSDWYGCVQWGPPNDTHTTRLPTIRHSVNLIFSRIFGFRDWIWYREANEPWLHIWMLQSENCMIWQQDHSNWTSLLDFIVEYKLLYCQWWPSWKMAAILNFHLARQFSKEQHLRSMCQFWCLYPQVNN